MDPKVNKDGLLDVIAALTAGGQTGRLQITSPATRGALFFRDGKLIDAHMGLFSGFPAINLAVSIREATFTFDPSIQSSRTAVPIPLNERLLLKERFGIETSELLAVEDPGNVPKAADLETFDTTDFALPEDTQGVEVNDAKGPAGKNSPVLNPIERTAHVRESRRRAARNRVAGRQRNKAPALADQFWKQKAEQVDRDVTPDQTPALRILEEDNRKEESASAKAPEPVLLEPEANPRTESAGEPANSGLDLPPTISQESLAANTRHGATTKRCPKCNRVYDDSRNNYCPYDAAILVTQSYTSLNAGAETQFGPRTVLFWILIIFTFLASGVFTYWLNSYFS